MYWWALLEVTVRGENLGRASWRNGARIPLLCCGFRGYRRGLQSNERRLEVKIHTFVIGSVLALALFLFAQQRPGTPQPDTFREVVDLTHSLPTHVSDPAANSAYRLQN